MTPEFEKTTAILALSVQDVMVCRTRASDNAPTPSETILTIRRRLLRHMLKLRFTGRGNLPLSTRQHVSRILDVTRPGWGHQHSDEEILNYITQACENALAPRSGVTDAQKRTWEEQIAGRQRLLQIALEAKEYRHT